MFRYVGGQSAIRDTEISQYSPRVHFVKKVDGTRIESIKQRNIELLEESRSRHPEIIAKQDKCLYTAAVALPQCVDELRSSSCRQPWSHCSN